MDEILNIISKKLTGEATDSELTRLKQWSEESEANAQLLEEQENVWATAGQADFGFEPDVNAAWEKVNEKLEVTRTRSFSPVLRIAASVAIVLGLGAALFFYLNPNEGARYAADAEKMQVTLPDGSEIWLNRNSEISLASNYNEEQRSVKLIGEAFFKVKRDEEKPFIIVAGETTTRVLGTSFNIKNIPNSNTVELTVVTGKVLFSNAEEEITLSKGEKGIATGTTVSKEMNANRNFAAWKEQKLEFNDNTLREVFLAMGNYFGVDIGISNGYILQCRFTGIFEKPQLDKMIEVISISANLKTEKSSGKVLFSGDGCPE